MNTVTIKRQTSDRLIRDTLGFRHVTVVRYEVWNGDEYQQTFLLRRNALRLARRLDPTYGKIKVVRS